MQYQRGLEHDTRQLKPITLSSFVLTQFLEAQMMPFDWKSLQRWFLGDGFWNF
jgi:hypothetical protein